MALTTYLFENNTEGTALTNGNSGSVASSLGTGSSAVFAAAMKAHGSFGARFINGASANAFRRFPLSTASTQWQFSGVVTLPASTPTENVAIAGFPRADGNNRIVIGINANGRVYVTGVGGAGIADVITTSLTPGQKYRITVQCLGGSTSASIVTVKVYSQTSGSWTTQVDTTWSSSSFNTGTEAVIGVDIGIVTARSTSYTVGWDDVQLNDGAGGEIGDVVDALPTPVVTLGATTHPTTAGASDGSQVVSWPSVSGASSYEAWIASGSSPAQNAFSLVAVGVTSPYTFTNLSAGVWSYGIKAKA